MEAAHPYARRTLSELGSTGDSMPKRPRRMPLWQAADAA
jgi:hypothetical protein